MEFLVDPDDLRDRQQRVVEFSDCPHAESPRDERGRFHDDGVVSEQRLLIAASAGEQPIPRPFRVLMEPLLSVE